MRADYVVLGDNDDDDEEEDDEGPFRARKYDGIEALCTWIHWFPYFFGTPPR